MTTYPGLPAEASSRTILVNDLKVHYFEVKPLEEAVGLIVLLHGFPETAYSWRKVLLPLSRQGHHIVAPDLRGYGQTEVVNGKFPVEYDDDLAPFRPFNMSKDIVSFVYALGYDKVALLVGHDVGSLIAGNCAIIRPDLFQSVVLTSAPYTGPPKLHFGDGPTAQQTVSAALAGLAGLDPPRKHYVVYNSTRDANEDLLNAPQGFRSFLREYIHMKSADWEGNSDPEPHPLSAPTAAALSVLPKYYVMLKEKTMPQTTLGAFTSHQEPAWLTDEELEVYVGEYTRTGFQGGLNWYRCMLDPKTWSNDLLIFSGKRIEIPAMYIGGKNDWGVYQYPGAAQLMQEKVCTRMAKEDFVLIEGAGHWVQQEKSEAVVEQLFRFLDKYKISV